MTANTKAIALFLVIKTAVPEPVKAKEITLLAIITKLAESRPWLNSLTTRDENS